MLVTQNIDDYHPMLIKQSKILMNAKDPNLEKFEGNIPIQLTPFCQEIHGNSFYMHCEDEEQEHSKIFYAAPKHTEVKDFKNHVPKCKECGKNMKPHSMFFDESYSEHYYRKHTVNNFYETCDLLIVIGTALATTFANNIVCITLEKETPVIEVNLEPCINVGHTF
jgi:NAD-dependent SIR2 family protein deacetylase